MKTKIVIQVNNPSFDGYMTFPHAVRHLMEYLLLTLPLGIKLMVGPGIMSKLVYLQAWEYLNVQALKSMK